jgi:putative phosphoribosyl transferase
MEVTGALLLPFHDRRDAGRMLAASLRRYRDRPDAIVLALPRGGIVPAAEIADALALPLDVVISRKLRAPGNAEYAIGAIAEGGSPYLNPEAVRLSRASEAYVAAEVARQCGEIARRQRRFRGSRAAWLPAHATVILVDDGVATGSTAIAAIRVLRERSVARLVLAIPVAPPDTAAVLRPMVDELVVLATPRRFHAVGAFYEDFSQVADDEVVEALARAETRQAPERYDAKEEADALA